MDIDRLVMAADPAKNRAPLHGTSATAQWTYGQITRVGTRRVTAPARLTVPVAAIVVAVTVTVVAAVLFAHLVPALNGPRPTAASVLDSAAATARHHPAPQPGPGQYLYSESKSLYQVTLYQGAAGTTSTGGTSAAVGTVQYIETEQSWTTSDGAGRSVLTRGALQYPSAGDRRAWNAVAVGRQFVSDFEPTVDSASPAAVDVSGLSTRPSVLARQLASGAAGLSGQPVGHGPSAVFERAAVLLVGPDKGSTPALASALYKVLSRQPGVTVLGTTTDHSGRAGTAVSLSSATGVTEVIIDPDTGAVLEEQFPAPPTSRASPRGQATTSCRGCSHASPLRAEDVSYTVTPLWTDTESSSVVATARSTQPVVTKTP